MYRQMINFIELMVVSLMALVATSISMLTWYQVVGMFFAAVFMLFISIELECGESKRRSSNKGSSLSPVSNQLDSAKFTIYFMEVI